ncbi:type I restriction enzyme subunit R domain-containing protein [Klebsiella pneumoniae]|uniref:type I restriction enzyme subunit R domain-containing protein n=1 Tax=Klebsiella pneumoniae TaxID=573 RepID=UPI003A4C5357
MPRRLTHLFVDKNLRYHGLMQAFSRTNRIYDATKTLRQYRDFQGPGASDH